VAYFVISQFGAGVDTRAPVFESDPGTLYVGTDVHLTSAGHIELRKAFVHSATLPAGTFGLAGVGDDRYVFGSVAPPPGLPTGVFYQQLAHPFAATMTDVLDVELFDGKFYVIGEYTNDVVHFYDAARVADWLVTGEVDANAFSGGRSAKTLGEKMYVTAGANLHFSATADPTKFKTAEIGAGFINLATHSSGGEELVAAELYYENLAVCSKDNVQVWGVASDPTENRRIQTLRGTGLVAPRAMISYLDGDTFFLSYQGVRSIQPRDSSGRSGAKPTSAQVNRELVAYLKSLSAQELAKALMLVEPEENRLWVILGRRVYVLNWFPEKNIKGWTQYNLDFDVDWAAVVDRRVWLRGGDELYLYGGENDDQYFEGVAIVRLPYVDMRAPATFKGLRGFDAGVEGTWEVYAGQRPDEPEVWERIAVIEDQTYDQPTHPLIGSTSHLSLEFRHNGSINERALISAVALHYKSNEAS
jgi:hypothetical protein